LGLARSVKAERKMELDWESFGWSIVDRVLDALDYWCWRVHDHPLECYSAHADMSLYELAERLADWSRSGITERDLEKLREMPDPIYRKLNEYVRRRIEEVIDELRELERR
jgi:hypothetical protein